MDDAMFMPTGNLGAAVNNSTSSVTSHGLAPRACVTCAKAKAKCTYPGNADGGEGEGKCERCARLKKECLPAPPPVRKRRIAKTTSRVGQLEEKLDDLVMLLKSSQHGLTNDDSNQGSSELPSSLPRLPTDPATGISLVETFSKTTESCSHINDPTEFPLGNHHYTRPVYTPASTPSSTTISSYRSTDISPHEATKFLNRFREMIPYFPFVALSPEVTAEQLRRERPFLWLSIMAITCREPVKQAQLGLELRRDMSERVFVRGEKNVDILLGILIHAAWCHFHYHISPQLTNLIQLAMSIIFDLGFNKRPPPDTKGGMVFDEALRQGFHASGYRPPTRSLEEKRATIGVYYLSSVAAAYFQKIDTLRWTPYMDECVKNLAEAAEYPSDVSLQYIIKLQHITDRVRSSPWYESYESTEGLKVPPAFFIKTLEAQLKDFRESLPPAYQNNTRIQMQYHCVALSVYEIGLSRSPLLASFSTQDFSRLEILYSCLTALKAWFDLFFTIPPALYYSMGTPTCTQLAHALIIFAKITTFESPEWDLNRVRDIMEFVSTVDRVIRHFEAAEREAETDVSASEGGNDVFTRTAAKLQKVKTWFEAKVAVDSLGPDIAVPVAGNNGNANGLDEVMAGSNFEIDENFWQDILGDWAYNMDSYPVIM